MLKKDQIVLALVILAVYAFFLYLSMTSFANKPLPGESVTCFGYLKNPSSMFIKIPSPKGQSYRVVMPGFWWHHAIRIAICFIGIYYLFRLVWFLGSLISKIEGNQETWLTDLLAFLNGTLLWLSIPVLWTLRGNLGTGVLLLFLGAVPYFWFILVPLFAPGGGPNYQ